MEFHTINLNLDNVKEEEYAHMGLTVAQKKVIRSKERETIKSKVMENIQSCHEIIHNDPEFIAMRTFGPLQEEFDASFEEAFQMYVKGDWPAANGLLSKCLELNPRDGPSKTMRHYIESFGVQAPDDWEGYRKLTSK